MASGGEQVLTMENGCHPSEGVTSGACVEESAKGTFGSVRVVVHLAFFDVAKECVSVFVGEFLDGG